VRLSGAAVGYLLLVVSVVGYGGGPRGQVIAGDHSSALMLNALRGGIAAVVMVGVIAVGRIRLPRGRSAVWVAVSGLLYVVFLEGYAEGAIRAGAGNAGVLANVSPLFVLVFARLFLGERVPLIGVLGLVVGIGGVVVMVSSQLGGREGSNLALGMVWALAAAAAVAGVILLLKWVLESDPQLDVSGVTALQLFVAGGVLVPLAFAIDGTQGTDWSVGGFWAAILFLALGNAVIATLAFYGALKSLPATTVSASLILVPVVAVLVEAVRGKPPGGVVLAGMALAVGGVALVIFRTRLQRARPGQEQAVDLAVASPRS
jgi:drug/metabolite transporter (DMT)-like permease